jgi:hypothetical protein
MWNSDITPGAPARWAPNATSPANSPAEADFRFATANNNLYAFGYKYPETNATIRSLSASAAKVEHVTLLGTEPRQLQFRQSAEALIVTMPPLPELSTMPYTSASKAPTLSAPCSLYPPI